MTSRSVAERRAEFPVAIIGGGVVGLSAALFLARASIECVLVERHPTTSIHPRARGVNGRTMELIRSLGLEDAVRQAGTKLAPALGIHTGANLREVLDKQGDGGPFMRFMRKRGMRGQASRSSPTGPCRCTQDELEPVLLGAARERGVDARFNWQLESLHEEADAVRCIVRERASGELSELRAQYVIAADGARSPTREALGIARTCLGEGATQMNLYFRADLRELVRGREFSMCAIEQPTFRGLITSIDNAELWIMHVSYDPARERPEDFNDARCKALIRAATGVPDLEIAMKGALPWESATRIADRYRHGRVFLAGDAAHIMPPWGGFGANTGIQDAHNLVWKLAAALSGKASDALLDTYETERRPLALAVGALAASMNDPRGLMRVSSSRFAMLGIMLKVFPYLGVGYGYDSAAVVLERGARPGPGTRELRGRPGTRLPHFWLRGDDAQPRSTLDLVGRNFLLLTGPQGDAWRAAGAQAQQRAGIALDVVQLGRDVTPLKASAARKLGIGSRGALLVRPDGFVAFRTREQPHVADGGERLAHILDRLHGRNPSTSSAPVAATVAAIAT